MSLDKSQACKHQTTLWTCHEMPSIYKYLSVACIAILMEYTGQLRRERCYMQDCQIIVEISLVMVQAAELGKKMESLPRSLPS